MNYKLKVEIHVDGRNCRTTRCSLYCIKPDILLKVLELRLAYLLGAVAILAVSFALGLSSHRPRPCLQKEQVVYSYHMLRKQVFPETRRGKLKIQNHLLIQCTCFVLNNNWTTPRCSYTNSTTSEFKLECCFLYYSLFIEASSFFSPRRKMKFIHSPINCRNLCVSWWYCIAQHC